MNMKKYLIGGFALVLLVGLVLPASTVEAARGGKLRSILSDNFDKYDYGSIVGQGDWFDREDGSFYVVQDAIRHRGRKALYSDYNSTNSIITKTDNKGLSDGKASIYVRADNRAGWINGPIGENVTFGVYQGSWDGPTRALMGFKYDGTVGYIDTTNIITGEWVSFDTFVDNAWNLLEIEWRSTDNSARFRVNKGSWTDWTPFVGAPSFTGFDTIGLMTSSLGSGGVYIDSLR